MTTNASAWLTVELCQHLVLCACLQCNGDLSASDIDAQVSGKLGVQLSDVVGIQSVLERLSRIESSPRSSSSSASSSSDVTSDYPAQQQQQQVSERSRKASKSSTVVVVNPARYKTELCRQYEEHGSCRYGDKCQFAHGATELRTLVRHPKYKTEMCRTFHTTGFCPYGLRCHFIHNDDERRANAVLDSTARHCDATTHGGGPSSPPSLATLTGDRLLVAQPQPPHSRPIYRSSSSLSPPSTTTFYPPEVDSEQRGRPILARGSTLPERSSMTYPYINQQVSFLSASDARVTGDLTTAVRAPCA